MGEFQEKKIVGLQTTRTYKKEQEKPKKKYKHQHQNVKFCAGTQILGLGNHLDFHHNRSWFPNMHFEPLM
jgi:hypothetical protein